jgi:hypothetical protein
LVCLAEELRSSLSGTALGVPVNNGENLT